MIRLYHFDLARTRLMSSSNGLATAGKPWLLAANHYDNVIEQAFAGHIGELRIVTRALKPSQFLNA